MARWASLALVVSLLGATVATAPVASASTTTLYVAVGGTDVGTCQAPTSPCLTISYAVSAASPGDTIDVGPGTFSDNVAIAEDLTIDGDSGGTLVNAADPNNPVFNVTAGTVTLDLLSIMGATYGAVALQDATVDIVDSTVAGAGTGVAVGTAGILDISDSTVADNQYGISAGGSSATIMTSTIDGNQFGVYALGPVTIVASTLDNSPADIVWANPDATVDMAGTIVASAHTNCVGGVVVDEGYNLDDRDTCGLSTANHSLSDADADLEPPGNYGGPTQTQTVGLSSQAYNQIPVGTMEDGFSLCPGTDQRGVARPVSAACDIGAVEVALPAQAFTSRNSATATAGSPFTFTVTTQGTPAASVTEKGKLPRGLKFKNNKDGTGTIWGTPKKAGVSYLTLDATYGKGKTKHLVSQSFILSVDAR